MVALTMRESVSSIRAAMGASRDNSPVYHSVPGLELHLAAVGSRRDRGHCPRGDASAIGHANGAAPGGGNAHATSP